MHCVSQEHGIVFLFWKQGLYSFGVTLGRKKKYLYLLLYLLLLLLLLLLLMFKKMLLAMLLAHIHLCSYDLPLIPLVLSP
jgi:hypothetical protein